MSIYTYGVLLFYRSSCVDLQYLLEFGELLKQNGMAVEKYNLSNDDGNLEGLIYGANKSPSVVLLKEKNDISEVVERWEGHIPTVREVLKKGKKV